MGGGKGEGKSGEGEMRERRRKRMGCWRAAGANTRENPGRHYDCEERNSAPSSDFQLTFITTNTSSSHYISPYPKPWPLATISLEAFTNSSMPQQHNAPATNATAPKLSSTKFRSGAPMNL